MSKAAKDTILTSRTGNDAFKRGALKAFTLIELLVVLSILSILMFIITPRFAAIINPERAKNFVLTLQNSLRYLNEKAILEQQVYLFNFDLDEGRYYFSMVGEEDAGFGEQEEQEALVPDHFLKPGLLPVRLNVEKVVMIPGEGVSSGKVTVPFTPNGMMFSFEVVFISDDGRRYLLVGNSYSNRIRLFVSQNEEEWRLLE